MSNKSKQIVNYVWINKDIFEEKYDGTGEPINAIPLTAIDKSIQNAKAYTDATINIWIDFRFVDDESRKRTIEYIKKAQRPNIKIRSLEDIESYLGDPLMDMDTDKSIWARTDYARLQVLDNVMSDNPDALVVYADFDVPDLWLDNDELEASVMNYGLALSNVDSVGQENNYFAFRGMKGQQFLTSLVKATKWKFEDEQRKEYMDTESRHYIERNDAWNALRETLEQFDILYSKALGISIVPASRGDGCYNEKTYGISPKPYTT